MTAEVAEMMRMRMISLLFVMAMAATTAAKRHSITLSHPLNPEKNACFCSTAWRSCERE
jgi:hypothetical protein